MNNSNLGAGGFVPNGYSQHQVPVGGGIEQHHPGQFKMSQGASSGGAGEQLVSGDHSSLPHLSLLPQHHLSGTGAGAGAGSGGASSGAGGVAEYGGTPSQMRNRCKLGVFSHRVCEKVSAIKVASYHEMTEHLINMELGDGPGRSKNPEAKNIRRRVYDVLNVLLAIGVVRRSVGVGKNLIWAGLDPDRPLIDQLVERSRMDHTGRLSSGPDELRSEEQARAEVETAKIAYLTAFEAQVNALQETVRQRISTCNDKDVINVADYIGLNQLLQPVQHPHLNAAAAAAAVTTTNSDTTSSNNNDNNETTNDVATISNNSNLDTNDTNTNTTGDDTGDTTSTIVSTKAKIATSTNANGSSSGNSEAINNDPTPEEELKN